MNALDGFAMIVGRVVLLVAALAVAAFWVACLISFLRYLVRAVRS